MSATATALPESGIRRITNAAIAIPDCIRLEMGEPQFATPEHICDAAAQAARDGFTKYTASQGLLSLREAASAKLARVNGIEVPPERIVATNGALSGLFTTCLALLAPGDEMLIPDPGWPNWEQMILTAGARPVRYPTPKDRTFLPDPEAMDELVGPRTRAILLNSPSNPTGAVMPAGLVRAMVEFARRHDLWVVSDECYDECVFEGEHVSPARFDVDGRVISLFSCSKTYAMTGWRVGYVAAPESAIGVIAKLQQPVLGNICSVAQKAAEAALTGPQDCVRQMRAYYRERRDQAVAMLAAAGMPMAVPGGAFYLMVDVSRANPDATAFALDLLHRHKVAVAPGETFGPGAAGLVRVALCASEEAIAQGLGRLIEVVRSA
ncbi:MAG: pyridoxal phosphate-dependent aminotransferase [Novosphingobium sp.]